jgi:hypothetical protein
MRRRGLALVDRVELDADTWRYEWEPTPTRAEPKDASPAKPRAEPRSSAARPNTGRAKAAPKATAKRELSEADALADGLIAAYQETLREAGGSVPSDQMPLVVNAVARSAHKAAQDMKTRLDMDAGARLEAYAGELDDPLGDALGWVSGEAKKGARSQLKGVVTGTTTLAAIHAQIAGAAAAAAAVAFAIAGWAWSAGSEAGHNNGFVIHGLGYFVFGGVAGGIAKNMWGAVKEAWRGPREAMAHLDRVLTPTETRFFSRLGSSPPQRLVLKGSGAVQAAVIAAGCAAIAAVCGIFVLAAALTWLSQFNTGTTGSP